MGDAPVLENFIQDSIKLFIQSMRLPPGSTGTAHGQGLRGWDPLPPC